MHTSGFERPSPKPDLPRKIVFKALPLNRSIGNSHPPLDIQHVDCTSPPRMKRVGDGTSEHSVGFYFQAFNRPAHPSVKEKTSDPTIPSTNPMSAPKAIRVAANKLSIRTRGDGCFRRNGRIERHELTMRQSGSPWKISAFFIPSSIRSSYCRATSFFLSARIPVPARTMRTNDFFPPSLLETEMLHESIFVSIRV